MDITEFTDRYHLLLNPQQLRAVEQTDGHTLLLAVPGSGKTTVMIARLGYLIFGRAVFPGSVLNLSYNVAAVSDLRQRFEHIFGSGNAETPVFRTINGFCACVLIDYARLTGKKLFHLMSGANESDRFLRHVFCDLTGTSPSDLQLRELQKNLSYARNRMLSPADIEKINFDTIDISTLLHAYTKQKIARRVMDYDDQLEYAYRILKSHPELCARYQRQFPYIQVDEAQDISLIQHEIIHLLARTGSLMMVGDEDQSIYGFRAADPNALFSFTDRYPGATVLALEDNYRSTPEIVRAANWLIRRNVNRHPKQMHTAQSAGPAPQRIRVSGRIAQYPLLESRIASSKERTAILYRNNESALPLIDLLTAHGIPFFCREHDVSYLNHFRITDICAMLRFARHPNDETLFRNEYHKIGLPIPRAAMEQALLLHRKTPDKSLLSVLIDAELCSDPVTVRLRTEQRIFMRIARMKTYDALNALKNDTRFGETFSAQNEIRLDTLLAIAAHNPDPERFLTRLDELRTQIRNGIGDVHASTVLSTIHSAKGLEFDRVILMDAYDGILPAAGSPFGNLQTRTQQMEEERRLFYVAITRARRELIILEYGNGKEILPARFVSEMFCDPAEDHTPADPFTYRPGDRITHRKFGDGVIVRRAQSTAEIRFDRIPGIRRFDLSACVRSGIIRPKLIPTE